MVDNKVRTVRELRVLASAVDQYPGLGDFAETQVAPVIERLRVAQAALRSLASVTEQMAARVDHTVKQVNELAAYTDSQPFTTLGRMANIGIESQVGDLAGVSSSISNNATELAPVLTAAHEAFVSLTKTYNDMSSQVEAAKQPAAQAAPPSQPQPSSTSTSDPSVQYEYETPGEGS